ncbi:tyrosine-protein kinase receptor torso-like [Ostrea edulis]|uniref:tyrosine-protein kinase receptor torso-like n=1 Tax=Ostrea edulis TaxID=37623 RepID=UPI0024AF3EEC|nr:tyrosine-protein kinase receptor torso-like [Ostrea edulis]
MMSLPVFSVLILMWCVEAFSITFNYTELSNVVDQCRTRCYLQNFKDNGQFSCRTPACKQCLIPCSTNLIQSRTNCQKECGLDQHDCISSCSFVQSTSFNQSFVEPGIMMHLALQTCRFNEPAMGNISQTFNVVLKWNPESSDINVTEYTIWRKIKLDSFQEREWQLINITNASRLKLDDLTPEVDYKFKVVPVSLEDGRLMQSSETEWIKTFGGDSAVQKPAKVTVSNETIKERSVKVLLSWDLPPDKPCYYKLFWMSANCGSHKSRVVDLSTLPGPSLWISKLGFGCDYKFDIQSSVDSIFNKVSDFRVTSYRTIDCLPATSFNYSICAPESPSEIGIKTVETYIDMVHNMTAGDILLSWKPPPNISLNNRINVYRVNFRKVAPLHYLKYLTPHVNITDVPGNQTSVIIRKLHWYNSYRFSVSAISGGGESKGCTETFKLGRSYESLNKEETVKVEHPSEAVIAVVIVVIGILVAFLMICIIKRRKAKQEEDEVEAERKNSEEAYNPLYLASPQSSCMDPLLIDDMEICFENLRLMEVIGEGAFGKVHRGEYQQEDGKMCTVAVKMLKEFADKPEEKSLLTEIDAMKQLGSHPNIVGMLGYCTKLSSLCLLMDYCPLGDLRKYLLNCRHQMMKASDRMKLGSDSGISPGCDRGQAAAFFPPESDILEVDSTHSESDESESCIQEATLLSYARQIAIGMEFLSQRKFIHRDLAARNILMVDSRRLKISDFGLTRDIYETNMYQPTSSRKLPYKWMAIESIFDQIFTIKSDIWSFGIVLWEIVTLGGSPYPGIPNEDLFRLLKDGYRMDKPENCSADIYQMMLSAWHPNAQCRPSFSDLRQKLESMLEATESYINLSVSVSQDYYTNDNSSRGTTPCSMPDSVTDSTGSRISSYFVMNAQGETNPSPVVPNTYLALPQNMSTHPNECQHGLKSVSGYNTEQCDMCRSIPCALCKSDSINTQDDLPAVYHLKDLSTSRNCQQGSKAVYTETDGKVDSEVHPSVMIIT